MSRLSGGRKLALILSSVCVGLVLAVLVGLICTGYYVGWGPFAKMSDIRYAKLAGNSEEYALDTVEPLEESPLEGKRVLFLGSSVTYGAASLQTSFVEYLAKKNNFTYVKEAVSGTTLVDSGTSSYISRLERVDKGEKFDLFVCQLSTNDATQNKALGTPGAAEPDTQTICGAIEYIADYVKATWNCPVVFYTNAYYENALYADMVAALHTIAARKDIFVIDLYTDEAFNAITEEERELYMADAIHPTRAGYLLWWTPEMQQDLERLFAS